MDNQNQTSTNSQGQGGQQELFSNPALYQLNRLLAMGSNDRVIFAGIKQAMAKDGFLVPVKIANESMANYIPLKLAQGMGVTVSNTNNSQDTRPDGVSDGQIQAGQVLNFGPTISINDKAVLPVFSSWDTLGLAWQHDFPRSGAMPITSDELAKLLFDKYDDDHPTSFVIDPWANGVSLVLNRSVLDQQ